MKFKKMKYLIVINLIFSYSVSCKSNPPQKTVQINQQKSNWSDYQGTMHWEEASAICKSRGMRLPTRQELVTAQKDGLWEKWKKERVYKFTYYFTSEEYSTDSVYYVKMHNGKVFISYKQGFACDVRCIYE
jgi:hypothetical protein